MLSLICTLPLTNAHCERNISRLRTLKTDLRSTMGETRLDGLDGLALMFIHRNIAVDVDKFYISCVKTLCNDKDSKKDPVNLSKDDCDILNKVNNECKEMESEPIHPQTLMDKGNCWRHYEKDDNEKDKKKDKKKDDKEKDKKKDEKKKDDKKKDDKEKDDKKKDGKEKDDKKKDKKKDDKEKDKKKDDNEKDDKKKDKKKDDKEKDDKKKDDKKKDDKEKDDTKKNKKKDDKEKDDKKN